MNATICWHNKLCFAENFRHRIHKFYKFDAQEYTQRIIYICSNSFIPECLNSNTAGLCAGAKVLYVAIWLFTRAVCMILLRKMSRQDFKHTIIFFIFSFVKIFFAFLRLPWDWDFWAHASFKRRTRPRHIFKFFFEVTICFNKISFQKIAQRLLWFLINNIGYYIGNCFKASFPTTSYLSTEKG